MRIKRIHAEDMYTALARVREELGPDAVIVSTRTLGSTRDERRRGATGVEVIAGVDERPTSIMAEARAVAGNAAAAAESQAPATGGVAPGAARAAYALGRASGSTAGSAGARPPGLPLHAVSTPAPATPPPAREPAQVSAPQFRRVSRDGDDDLDLDTLVPALEALASRMRAYPPAPSERTYPPAPSLTGGGATAYDHAGRSVASAQAQQRTSTHAAMIDDQHVLPLPLRALPRTPGQARGDQGVPADLQGGRGDRSDFTSVLRSFAAPSPIRGGEPEGLGSAPASAPVPTPRWVEEVEDVGPEPELLAPPSPRRAGPAQPGPEGSGGRRADPLAAAARAFGLLRAAGLSEPVAEAAIEEAIRVVPPAALGDSERLLETGLARLVAGLPGAPSLSAEALAGRTVCFVGAAGVGKTTALLKAALELRRTGAEVGIVGADVSHLGAPEQLLRYGELLRLPAEVAYTPDDLAEMLTSVPDGGVTLIDTPACIAGRALPEDLAGLLAVVPDAVVVLTVAAGAGERDLERLAETARATGARAVAITRLDEAPAAAPLNVIAGLRLPPLLCSTGRDVLAEMTTDNTTDLAVAALEAALAADGQTDSIDLSA